MSYRILKIFGERNTGTRALIRMIEPIPGIRRRFAPLPEPTAAQERTARAIDAHLGGKWRKHFRNALRDDLYALSDRDDPWKHALPRLTPAMIGARVATLMMVRNPYSWLLSLWHRPYHQIGPDAVSFEDFVARPWMTERREGLASVLGSPVDLWVLKAEASLSYRDFARAAGLPCTILRFEEFVLDAEPLVRDALTDMGLPTKGLRRAEENTKPDGLPLAALRQRYRQETWRQELSERAIGLINARLDHAVAAAHGYKRLDAPDGAARRSDREACPAAAT